MHFDFSFIKLYNIKIKVNYITVKMFDEIKLVILFFQQITLHFKILKIIDTTAPFVSM